MKKLFVVLLLSLSNVYAISELNYKQTFDSEIRPFMKTMEDGVLKSNGLNLHYKTLIDENAPYCMIVLPGRSESAEKYSEFIYDLKKSEMGSLLNFFVLDHRGQGSSDRMTDKLDMGYVDQFENYVSDLDNFLTQVVPQTRCKKKFLFAHSMGAGIGLSWVTSHGKYFDGLMISSPMLKIQTKPYAYAVAKSIVTAMMAIGKGDEFAIGQKPFNSGDDFETNKFTTSKARYKMTMDLFEEFPKTKLGGVSNRWLFEVMNGTRKLRSRYDRIKIPMHVYRAGTELYSEPEEMHKLCTEALQCEEMVLDTSKHEVVNDSDENRGRVLEDIVKFIDHFKAE